MKILKQMRLGQVQLPIIIAVAVIFVAIGLLAYNLFTQSKDCTTSSSRSCYDKQTGKKIIGLESKGGENAFAACLKNAAPNEYGELVQKTGLCEEERFQYCYEGKSKVLLRKFDGQCKPSEPPGTPSTASCPSVPALQVYSFVESGSWFARYSNDDIETLFQSKSGAVFAGGTKYIPERVALIPVIYKSLDNGKNWVSTQVPENPEESYVGRGQVMKIIEDPSGILWAGGMRLYKSTDGGDTWTIVSEPPIITLWDFIQTKDGSLVAVGTPGVIKSTDAGKTWQWLVSGLTQWVDSVIEADDGALVYSVSRFYKYGAGGEEGIYRYLDGVSTRTFVATPEQSTPLLKAKDGSIYYLAMNPDQPRPTEIVSFLPANYTASDYTKNFIVSYKSTDNGKTWVKTASLPRSLSALELFEGSDGSIYASAYSLCHENTIYKSIDQSQNWAIFAGMRSEYFDSYYSYHNLRTFAEIDTKILSAGWRSTAIFFKP